MSLQNVSSGINVRIRLLRKFFYRLWKNAIILRIKKEILSIDNEKRLSAATAGPAIILCALKNIKDLYVLMYLFREKDLSFVGLRSLERQKIFSRLVSLNRVLFIDPQKTFYPFLKNLLATLRDFNRSVVFFPTVDLDMAEKAFLDPALLVRIAMKASVPIMSVVIDWTNKQPSKCRVSIGKRFFVSPSTEEFRDIFFGRKGARKFSKLDREELNAIAKIILSGMEHRDGSNLS